MSPQKNKKLNGLTSHSINEGDKLTSSQEKKIKRFIVPPGLLKKVFEFHSLIETCDGAPILITGPTGVGKSLFIHMYKEWFKKKKDINATINTINCSHMEKNLSRSELFGHVKGAYTGAITNKDGWIKESEGGALILEEIGELTPECQAQLLTFIEDGKYHRVGGTEIFDAKNICILGATNKQPSEMREDFWNRFLNFYIPPLYQRRGDVLYYIAEQHPDMIKELHPWEALSLLAYHWPGNIREIDRVILSIKLAKHLRAVNPFKGNYFTGLHDISTYHSGLSPQDADLLFNNLKDSDFNVDLLESFLNCFQVGLSPHNEVHLFEKVYDDKEYVSHKFVMDFGVTNLGSPIEKKEEIAILKEYEDIFNIYIPPICISFYRAQLGYEIFCLLFFQHPLSNHNCLDVDHESFFGTGSFAYTQIPKKEMKIFEELERQAFKYLSKIGLKKNINIPKDYLQDTTPSRWEYLLNLSKEHPDNEFLSRILHLDQTSKNQEPATDIFRMDEKELLKYYYQGLLEKHKSVKKIADVSGKNIQTIYGLFKKKGISIINNK